MSTSRSARNTFLHNFIDGDDSAFTIRFNKRASCQDMIDYLDDHLRGRSVIELRVDGVDVDPSSTVDRPTTFTIIREQAAQYNDGFLY